MSSLLSYHSIRVHIVLLLCLIVGLGTIGCGGSSGGGSSVPSPYTGRYVGTTTSGTELFLNVAPSGNVTGTSVKGSIVLPLSGTLTSAGLLTITPTGPGIQGETDTGLLTRSGTNLSGTLNNPISGNINISIDPADSGSTPLYAGLLTGAFVISPAGDTGTITLIVDPNGNITGVSRDTLGNNTTVSNVFGVITNTGVTNLEVFSHTESGTLTITGTHVAGTLALSSGGTVTFNLNKS